MLSEKYYKVFAELIGKSVSLIDFEARLTEYLEKENSRFDKNRFSKAILETRNGAHVIEVVC